MKLIVVSICCFLAVTSAGAQIIRDCGKDQQFYGCLPCERNCTDVDTQKFCTLECVPGCACKPGYYFNKDGKCVEKKKCIEENKKCGKDQKYYDCMPCNQDCSDLYVPKICPYICKPGCACKDKHRFNKDRKCVNEKECTPAEAKCPGNLVYETCGGCMSTCDNYLQPRPCTLNCNIGCFCPAGLVYENSTRTCVKPSECQQKCPEHSTYQQCKGCPKKCTNMFLPEPCLDICLPGCVCDEGYVLDKNGKCIPKGQCPADEVKCPNNLKYNKCGGCVTTCENYGTPLPCPKNCNIGCFCPKDLVYNNTTRTCVKPSECSATAQKCPENATFKQCKGCPKTCETAYINVMCPFICLPGCVCNDGFVFDKKGKCIPTVQCPPEEVKCPNNLKYNTCGGCTTTCENYGKQAPCPRKCNIGCFCPKDLVYDNTTRSCVEPKQCSNTQTCPENASYQQCKGCPLTCGNMNINLPCPAICAPGCVCNKGYVFDKNGKCIPSDQCPADETKCPSNLEYTTCGGCPKTCENADKLIACTLDCKRGCQCPVGLYYNNATQSCVSKNECPKSDKNKECMDKDINSEYSTCGTCDPTCADRNPICTKECKIGCFCVKGFVKRNGKCILPCNCPKKT